MCETVCKSVCFVSFRHGLLAPHNPLSLHIFILCPFRYQPRYYRFRPFFRTGTGRHRFPNPSLFLSWLQGLKAQGRLGFGTSKRHSFAFAQLYSRRKGFQGVHELAPLGSPPRPCTSKLGMALGLIERFLSLHFPVALVIGICGLLYPKEGVLQILFVKLHFPVGSTFV